MNGGVEFQIPGGAQTVIPSLEASKDSIMGKNGKNKRSLKTRQGGTAENQDNNNENNNNNINTAADDQNHQTFGSKKKTPTSRTIRDGKLRSG